MKYFTRAWADGEFPDAETDKIRDAYWQHIRDLSPRLPAAVAQLANDVDLHDALIAHVRVDERLRQLTIHLVCGDVQHGYQDVELRYSGVTIGDQIIQVLRDRARDRESCILYDEVDVEADGKYVHRLLFWPEGEIGIRFQGLSLQTVARMDRRVELIPYYTADGDQPTTTAE